MVPWGVPGPRLHSSVGARRFAACALAILLGAGAMPAAHGQPAHREVAAARQAFNELRYAAARAELDAAFARGGLGRDDLVAALALAAELACVLDGAAAGEQAFRRVLVLEPDFRGPERDSPVFVEPFVRAREWAATAGRLRIDHRAPTPAEHNLALSIEVVADPLGMVADLRVYRRFGPRGDFERAPGDGFARRVEAPAPGTTLEYHLQVVDSAGNVIWQAGSIERPLVVRGVERLKGDAGDATSRGGIPVSVAWTAAAAGAFLAGGVAFDVAAHREYDALQASCAPVCMEDDLSDLQFRRNAAIGLYVAAAAATVTAVVAWWLR